jgi:hypothetical protein
MRLARCDGPGSTGSELPLIPRARIAHAGRFDLALGARLSCGLEVFEITSRARRGRGQSSSEVVPHVG